MTELANHYQLKNAQAYRQVTKEMNFLPKIADYKM